MGINDEALDRQLRHQIYTLRYAGGVRNRMLALMERAEADLVAQLFKRLKRLKDTGINADQATRERLEKIILSVQGQRATMMDEVASELNSELGTFADYEREFQIAMLNDMVTPVGFTVTAVPAAQIRAAALSRPFQGRIMKEWLRDLKADDARRVRNAIRIGFVEGETIGQIVKRVEGPAGLETTRRHATTIVRTAVNHTANAARSELARGNDDIIKGVRWVATLDSRTSPICRARDGKVYRPDDGPRPPAHPNCRSTITYIIKGVPGNTGTRASFDGQVPAAETYNTWLRKQPRSFVEDVLGKEKASIYLRGKLDLDQFIDRQGQELTIEELRAKERAAG